MEKGLYGKRTTWKKDYIEKWLYRKRTTWKRDIYGEKTI